MKNKKIMYILGLLVVIVWGMIISRIYESVHGSGDETPPTSPLKPVKEAYNDYSTVKDTAHLLLNYRDPFSEKKDADTITLPKRKRVFTAVLTRTPAMNWNFVKYSGYIRNPASKKLISILQINGQNVMLAEGEAAADVRLVKNLGDSVKIYFKDKTKFIKMQKGL